VPYLPRVVDAELDARLAAAGAVVIEGPKAAGKTETARQRVASSVLLDADENARRAAAVDPGLVLDGQVPRLIDEWQVEPGLWNHVRRAVDDRGLPGQFVLTGSSVPADDVARHTGAGRFSFLRMRPMTLFESGHTNGAVSLAALLAGEPPRSDDPGLTVRDLADRITVGGWPAQVGRRVADASRAARDYLAQIREVDVSRVAGSRRDPARVERLLRSLARNIATEVDNYGVEADAVVQLADGRWGAFEVKLGAGLVDEGAEALLRFRESVDTRKSGEPSVLAVIAGTGFGYVRPDGIAVIPVGSLAP